MDITNYDKIKIEFEEFDLILQSNIIEKLKVDELEHIIEKKYNAKEIYIVINRQLAEKIWKEQAQKNFERNSRQIFIGWFNKI